MAETEEGKSNLERVQEIDPSSLVRAEELGRSFDFQEVVEPAQRVIAFFTQIPLHLLSQLSDQVRSQIDNQATSFLRIAEQIREFDPAAENAVSKRQSLIEQVQGFHTQAFNALYQIVGYLATRQRDFSAIEHEAHESAKRAEAEAAKLQERLETAEAEAQRILAEVKATAAELGVSQEAIHFGAEASAHETAAGKWQGYTVKTAIGLGAFAVSTLAIGQWFLIPATPYEAFQLGLSKVLIFATIAFTVFLCARTLMAHRHNRVVNKHRQNALLTFNALVEATHGEEARDIVLTHASACIFAPQDSGFSKGQSSGQSLVEIMPRLSAASGQGSP